MSETITTIETSVYSRLDWMIRRIAQTAGLGIARGAVGIGKTYCMTQISRCLKEEGANVIMTTCSPTTEGNAPAFVKSILSARGFHQTGIVECSEAFEELVSGNPFGFPPQPAISLVDECQGAPASLDYAETALGHGR